MKSQKLKVGDFHGIQLVPVAVEEECQKAAYEEYDDLESQSDRRLKTLK